jgi:ABC-type nitrate/sulfonate/bicarbonate transport system substrate-binding protein
VTVARIVANFPNSAGSLAMWVAAERGLFAKRGLEVEFVQARGSASQYQALMAGEIQVFTTLMENIIAYAWGEGEVAFDPAPDAFVFMGASLGHQSLMAKPGIASVADLKGRTIAASGQRTGNALVLYAMLARHGLERDRDYRVVAVGGGPVNVAALAKAGADASLMGAPNDREALSQGFAALCDTTSTFGGYQSSIYTARRSWAEAHRGELVALIAALVEAHRALAADRDGAIRILRSRLPALAPEDAASIDADLVSGKGRFNRDGRIEEKDVAVVLSLRQQYALSPHPTAQPSDFYDFSYLDEALHTLTP